MPKAVGETGSGVRRVLLAFGVYGLVVWPVAAWLGVALIAGELARLDGLHVNASTVIGRDFVNIWHGGREALAGADGVYDRDAYRRSLAAAVDVHGIYAFSYPPHMLMLAVPFGLPPYLVSLGLWTFTGLALFVHAARPWLRDAGLPLWAALVLPGAIVNLWAAHFGFFIGAFALYGWRWAARAPVRAGGAFALMSVKPHMGVLVPLVLATRRDWRTMAIATVGVLLLAGASALIFGTAAWTTWLSSTLVFQANLIEPVARNEFSFLMPTVGRSVLSLTREPAIVLGAQLAAAAVALGLLGWAASGRAPLGELGLVSLVATPLLLPYSFNYDMVALSLVMLLWGARSPAPARAFERLAYAVAFIAPLAQAPLAREGLWLSPIAVLVALVFGAWRAAGRTA